MPAPHQNKNKYHVTGRTFYHAFKTSVQLVGFVATSFNYLITDHVNALLLKREAKNYSATKVNTLVVDNIDE